MNSTGQAYSASSGYFEPGFLGLSSSLESSFAALMGSTSARPTSCHAARLIVASTFGVKCGRRITSWPSNDSIHWSRLYATALLEPEVEHWLALFVEVEAPAGAYAPGAIGTAQAAQCDAIALRRKHHLAVDPEVGKRGGLHLFGQRLGFALEEDAQNHLAIVALELTDQPSAKRLVRSAVVPDLVPTPPPPPPLGPGRWHDGSLRRRSIGAGCSGFVCGA